MRRLTPLVPVTLAIAGLVLAGSAPAYATTSAVVVTPSQISTDPATTGGWMIDDIGGSNHGEVSIATPDVATGPALELHLPATSDKATLQYRYPTSASPAFDSGDDFAGFRSMLDGASYTFAGTNVNYQFGIFFKPVDPAYGPSGVGTDKCGVATSFDPDWCYTTIKYEPNQAPSSQTAVGLNGTFDDGHIIRVQSGWWRSQRVGQYAKAGSADDVSLNDMLAEMSDVVLYGFGVSLGPTITPGDTGFVSALTFDGTTYTFGPDPAPGSPYEDSADLESAGVVAATDFAPTVAPDGVSANTDFSSVDKDKPVYGDLTWTGAGDDYVDLYAFSTPTYIGTFPVIGGKVTVSASVSALPAGPHTFLFVGQTSGTQLAAGFTVVAAGPMLPVTGIDTQVPLAVAGALIVGGAVLLVVRRRKRGAHVR